MVGEIGPSVVCSNEPALDCADLAEQLRTNADAAYPDLARLDLVQLTLQAVCYAAYANELLGLDLSGDDVLAFWGVALARRGLYKEVAYDNA